VAIESIGQIKVGDSYSEEIQLDRATIARFIQLTRDRARGIHVDRAFAKQKGFDNLVVHGFLLAAQFSRILGMELPGEHTVMGSIELNFHVPVYAGDTVKYTATVKRVLQPLGSVSLELTIQKLDGTVCVAGRTTCAFKKRMGSERCH